MDGVSLAIVVLVTSATLTLGYVVPLVVADTFQGATAQRSLPVFQAVSLFDAAMAAGLAMLRPQLAQPGKLRFGALGLLAVAMLLQGLAYADATMAYLGHGPDMQGVTWLLGALSLALVTSATRLARSIWEVPPQA